MSEAKFWAIVPAAGVGKRMQADCPKQYLPLGGRSVIEETLQRLLVNAHISGVVVALGEADEYWPELPIASHPQVMRAPGGAERFHSVLNALNLLAEKAELEDWVLVHDAARPCIRQADLDLLINELADDGVGGLLALPVRDTMKRADQLATDRINETIDRNGLWHALTPQMFRLGALKAAIEQCIAQNLPITDDASAIEIAGFAPKLVEGHEDNIKITRPRDLRLAELYLAEQQRESDA